MQHNKHNADDMQKYCSGKWLLHKQQQTATAMLWETNVQIAVVTYTKLPIIKKFGTILPAGVRQYLTREGKVSKISLYESKMTLYF